MGSGRFLGVERGRHGLQPVDLRLLRWQMVGEPTVEHAAFLFEPHIQRGQSGCVILAP